MGILGMDCLRHYCIQLDFVTGKWRFLDPDHLQTGDLGQSFPLVRSEGCFAVRENLMGVKGPGSLIDTGCNFDGLLMLNLFQQWTNHSSGEFSTCAGFPNGILGGATYTNLDLHVYSGNVLGLSFLARHLVTLNFPKRTMYPKRISIGPLANDRTGELELFHARPSRLAARHGGDITIPEAPVIHLVADPDHVGEKEKLTIRVNDWKSGRWRAPQT